ncbi:MAG: LUD domain-containing protein [Nitrososphaerota archaeon]|nr:LUD domain-containing protein [Nitrososphaerota archaeon]MDG6969994.1 LUD domain-containing protein [Nitrososphaerota archaeon]MDG6975652.1 LUD domain-containing protein [Nitrososphaerota archaeon]
MASQYADAFARVFASRNGVVLFAQSKGATSEALRRTAVERGASSVAVAGIPEGVRGAVAEGLEGIEVIDVGSLRGAEAKEAVARADLSVTWAAHGVAKEGALMEATWDDATKLASCLPMTNVALVSEGSFLPDFHAAMRAAGKIVAESPGPKPTISFIAGPSRTADIESRLLYGVHGPHSVVALVLGWA